jgi:hypothetical protein
MLADCSVRLPRRVRYSERYIETAALGACAPVDGRFLSDTTGMRLQEAYTLPDRMTSKPEITTRSVMIMAEITQKGQIARITNSSSAVK